MEQIPSAEDCIAFAWGNCWVAKTLLLGHRRSLHQSRSSDLQTKRPPNHGSVCICSSLSLPSLFPAFINRAVMNKDCACHAQHGASNGDMMSLPGSGISGSGQQGKGHWIQQGWGSMSPRAPGPWSVQTSCRPASMQPKTPAPRTKQNHKQMMDKDCWARQNLKQMMGKDSEPGYHRWRRRPWHRNPWHCTFRSPSPVQRRRTRKRGRCRGRPASSPLPSPVIFCFLFFTSLFFFYIFCTKSLELLYWSNW